MPELPEVETLVRQLEKELRGRVLAGASLIHPAIFRGDTAALTGLGGKRITGWARRGKYLAMCLEGDSRLWFHLGMTGQLLYPYLPETPDAHCHAAVRIDGGTHPLIFRDVRKFGRIFLTGGDKADWPEGVRRLGPEPFDLSDEAFAGLFRGRRAAIKGLLLDQHIVAGVGNIYADESLFRAGIRPKRAAGRISLRRLASLRRRLVEVLGEAIAKGGSSIDDFRHLNGMSGRYQNEYRVYGRRGKNCLVCGSGIRMVLIAGRSSCYCPRCQN